MTAADLLVTLSPLGVVGLVLLDVNDPQTWTFQGENLDHAAVVAAIQTAVRSAPAVSQFWPPAQTAIERDVAALKIKLTGA